MSARAREMRWVIEEFTALAEDLKLPISAEDIAPETALLGRQSTLDSMGLVHLLAALEDRIAAETGRDLILADERAMSATVSPFRSVGSTSRFLAERLAQG